MSESLHELEAALADTQREAALAEDEYTERSARWNAKPTMKRHLKLWDAFHAREDAHHRFARAQEAVERARRAQDHPPLKEGLSTRVTDEDLATLRAEGQLFDVAAADAVDELDNPAAPIVEVDAPGRHRADEQSTPVVTLAPVNGEGRFVPTADVDLPVLEDTREWTAIGTIADGPAKGATAYMSPVGPNLIGAPTDAPCPCHYCTERRNEGLPNAFPEAEQDERDEAEAELGYTRNEQGAYEYDGPVGEQPDVPNYLHTEPVAQPWSDPNHDVMADLKEAWDSANKRPLGDFPDVGTPEWEAVIRSLYGISEDTPIMRHTEWKPKEPNVITVDHNRADRFYGLPVYVREGVAADTVYVLREDGDGGAVLMNPETFEGLKAKLDEVRPPNPDVASAFDLKAKLDAVRNVARSVDALDGVGDPVTKAEADEAPAQKTEEQAVIDAGKAAQERWESHYGARPWRWSNPAFPPMYQEAFAKAGDVPTAPADHVTGVTDPESVTVDTERDVQQFGSDTVKLKSQTITGSFTMTEARPEFFQKVFPNARVVIGSNGKVEITANSVENAAKAAESKPTTPEGKLLAEAAQIIGHDRNDQYGNAEDSFGVIAEFWSTWLTARWREVFDHNMDSDEYTRGYINLTAADVANMLGLMKKARTAVGGHKRDTYVDEAGYVALAERCEAKGSGL